MNSPCSVQQLPWDSDLMGFPVGRVEPACLGMTAPGELRAACRSLGLRLAYIAVPWADSLLRDEASALGAELVDQKIIYSRGFDAAERHMPEALHSFEGMEATPELESLALASGAHSRFRTDPRMAASVFPKLYLTWIRRSVRREIADVVLVATRSEILAGMVTVASREDHAEIGLLAVREAFRGQGIGRQLIEGAEAWAALHGVEAMTVATQGANVAACALYGAMGYNVAQMQAMYHFWIDPLPEPGS